MAVVDLSNRFPSDVLHQQEVKVSQFMIPCVWCSISGSWGDAGSLKPVILEDYKFTKFG
jgi:hypothetical protein